MSYEVIRVLKGETGVLKCILLSMNIWHLALKLNEVQSIAILNKARGGEFRVSSVACGRDVRDAERGADLHHHARVPRCI